MTKLCIVFFCFLIALSACAPPQTVTPSPSAAPTASAIPAAVLPTRRPASTATSDVTNTEVGELFSTINRSTDVLHLKCDPLEIIFDITVKSTQVKGVVFLFRMKDKASGLVNPWSNGENMRAVGGNIYEFVFRASAIPQEARYKDAWVQYQFVGVGRNRESIGHSPIFSKELTFTPGCPQP